MERRSGAVAIPLVEDDPRLRRAPAWSLAAPDRGVEEAARHESVVALLGANTYDLGLLDVNWPDATSRDVLRDLATVGRSLPTVVLSAVSPTRGESRSSGPSGCCGNPSRSTP